MRMEVDRVFNEDVLEGIKKIPERSVDAVITDPPYYVGFNSSYTEGGRQDWGNHTLMVPLFDFLFAEFIRILKKDGRVFMFCDWRTYPTLYGCASKYLRIANLIVWDYGWIKAGNQFRFSHELILHAVMPEAKPPKDRSMPDVWRFKPINYTQERRHPAEKPEEIIRKMLEETTEEGDLILDCFLGSGTTAVACKQLNRRFIGFEINPLHFKTALSRLNQSTIMEYQDEV